MNVPTIKLLCWLSSASLTFGLTAYAYDWFKNIAERKVPVDPEFVRTVLEEDLLVAPDVKQGLAYEEHVRRTFITMNWTGKPKAVAKAPEKQPDKPVGPRYKPIADVLRIILIQLDMSDPGGSIAHVTLLADGKEAELYVGDALPKPNDFAVVHAIRGDGVEFSFKEEERPNETVMPKTLDDETLIVKVGADGVQRPVRRLIPKAPPRNVDGLAETQLIGRNTYQLGDEDMQYFAENYPAILTRDVKTKTWFDSEGRRAGVELESVKDGSIAARHGAHAGDIIISINGHSVTSEQEAIKFVKNNSDKYSVWEVVVERLGRRETIVYKDK